MLVVMVIMAVQVVELRGVCMRGSSIIGGSNESR